MLELILPYIFFNFLIVFLGAFFSYKTKQSKIETKPFLGLASGFLLGLTLFHYAPEATETTSFNSTLYILLGFFLPIILETTFKSEGYENRSLVNTITLMSFSLHALFDGLILDASLISNQRFVFYGILIHQFPVAFSLFTIISTHTKTRKLSILMFLLFTTMTPIGVLFGEFTFEHFFLNFSTETSGFTIGMFLYISLFHLFYKHKLYKKNSSSYFLFGLSLPLLFFFIH